MDWVLANWEWIMLGFYTLEKIVKLSAKFFTKVDFFKAGKLMSGLEEKLGPGHQQIVLGLLIFAAGALWGIMLASGDEINLQDLFISAVIMLSGAMITMLGISFGTDNEDDRTNDLKAKNDELEGIISETKKDEEKLSKESVKAEKVIDERLLNAYKRLRGSVRNGLAVVPVLRDACGGCFNTVPPQRQMDIAARKKVIVCEHCGRVLVDKVIAGIE